MHFRLAGHKDVHERQLFGAVGKGQQGSVCWVLCTRTFVHSPISHPHRAALSPPPTASGGTRTKLPPRLEPLPVGECMLRTAP